MSHKEGELSECRCWRISEFGEDGSESEHPDQLSEQERGQSSEAKVNDSDENKPVRRK